MAINLAIKYAKKVAEMFTKESFVKPHTNGNLDFTGAKTVRVYKLETVDENDYKRSGSNRYGEPKDVQDSIFEYTMTQDKAFTGVVDKGDEADQTIDNKAGKFLRAQLREKTTPAADKYALGRFAQLGTVAGTANAPTKTTVVSLFADAQEAFDNALVPDADRVAYVPTGTFKLIAQSDEFIKLEKLGEKSVARGEVGELFGFRIVKVPKSYLPENCYFLCVHKGAVAMPYKLSETRILKEVQGISGAVVEGRHYYDAFVLGEKAEAVYACVLSSARQATPTITVASGAATLASAGAEKILYTTDGSDPRFSASAKQYGGTSVTVAAGDKVRAVAFGAEGKFTSEIAEKDVA